MKKFLLVPLIASGVLFANNFNYEITPILGYVDTKEHIDIKNQTVAGFSVAKNMDKNCKFDQLEVGLLQTLSKKDYKNTTFNTHISRLYLNGLKEYTINKKAKLYGIAGFGYEYISNEKVNNNSNPFGQIGVGIKYAINNTLSLKCDIRYLAKIDGDRDVVYTMGISIPFGAVAKQELDSDKDGILDKNDNCPNTPLGTKVGVSGCEIVAKIEKDSDCDGVLDSQDKCPNTTKGTVVDNSGCLLEKPENLGVLFATDSAKINSLDQKKFDKYIAYLKKVPTSKIILEGHTDSIGSAKYNLILSQKRANAVKDKLISMGIEASRIEVIGYGETKPLVANDTEENRQKNRRVTARIVNQ